MTTWPTGELPDDPVKYKAFLANYGMVSSTVLINNFGDRKFKHGAFSTNETAVRRETVKLAKEGLLRRAAARASFYGRRTTA